VSSVRDHSLERRSLMGLLVYVADRTLAERSDAIGMLLGRPLVNLLVVWNYLLQGSLQEKVCLGIVMGQDG
jgi:hypothetical protein